MVQDTPRWQRRPPGANWGEFGADDEIGRLNLIGPEQVIKGAREIREGLRFCLSLPLDLPGGNLLNPRRHPPRLFANERGGVANYNYMMARDDPQLTDVVSDDAVLMHTQYSTQWDALAHVGALFDADGDDEAELVYYNGWRGGRDVEGPPAGAAIVDDGCGARHHSGVRAHRLGIDKAASAAIQGRAVMINLHAIHGDERIFIDYDALAEAIATQRVEIEPGDMVCLHTGFARVVMEMDGQPDSERLHNACAVLDGRDPRLQSWVAESGLSALIADNYAVEGVPARPGDGLHAALPLHELCLFKLGVHLGELWYLTDLARWLAERSRTRFFLTAPPLRLPGAVGSPVTPVATV